MLKLIPADTLTKLSSIRPMDIGITATLREMDSIDGSAKGYVFIQEYNSDEDIDKPDVRPTDTVIVSFESIEAIYLSIKALNDARFEALNEKVF